MTSPPRALLLDMFETAIAAAAPARCLDAHLPPRPKGRLYVAAIGKAAAAMALAVEAHYGEKAEGVALTRHGHGLRAGERLTSISVIEAGHPMPDDAGLSAAKEVLAAAESLGEDDLLLCLLSGGGSSLLALPPAGVSLAEKQALTAALLNSGAPIGEINCVRRHVSAIKGGRLAAAAWPARSVTLAISDVAGDIPHDIASGPSVADPTNVAEACAILTRYRFMVPPAIARHLASPRAESKKPDDARLARSEFRIVASGMTALHGAANRARKAGYAPVLLGDDVAGAASEVARAHAELALGHLAQGRRVVLLSGGETTVAIGDDAGQGGRNSAYALAFAIALGGASGISALACDTDGIDGTGPHAGAIVDPSTLARARALGLDPDRALSANDSGGFFATLGDRVITGPTRTNVNDFRAILVDPTY